MLSIRIAVISPCCAHAVPVFQPRSKCPMPVGQCRCPAKFLRHVKPSLFQINTMRLSFHPCGAPRSLAAPRPALVRAPAHCSWQASLSSVYPRAAPHRGCRHPSTVQRRWYPPCPTCNWRSQNAAEYVRRTEIIPSRPGFTIGIARQAVVIHRQPAKHRQHHAAMIEIHDELLVAKGQTALKPARCMQNQVRTRHDP